MRVREVMTRPVVAVRSSQWLTEAAMLMKADDLDALPVISDDRVIGILTDHDIVVRVIAEGLDPHAVRAGEVASRPVVAARPDDDTDVAVHLMAQHGVRRLPVVEDARLVGIVSHGDVVAAAEAESPKQ